MRELGTGDWKNWKVEELGREGLRGLGVGDTEMAQWPERLVMRGEVQGPGEPFLD